MGCSCRCFCAQERAALPGAPMARRGGAGKSAGWPEGMQASFSPVHGCAVEKPRSPPAHPQGRMPGGRVRGVASLLRRASCPPPFGPASLFAAAPAAAVVTFLLATQEKSNSGAQRAHETALMQHLANEAKTSSAILHAERAHGCARLCGAKKAVPPMPLHRVRQWKMRTRGQAIERLQKPHAAKLHI